MMDNTAKKLFAQQKEIRKGMEQLDKRADAVLVRCLGHIDKIEENLMVKYNQIDHMISAAEERILVLESQVAMLEGKE